MDFEILRDTADKLIRKNPRSSEKSEKANNIDAHFAAL